MRAGPVLVWFVVAQALLLAVTAFPPFTPGLGAPTWHHNASLVVSLLVIALTWRPFLTDRTYLALGVFVTTALAVLSGFVLLYLKEGFKAWGLKDWMKWWHVLWSWFALWYLLGHVWINRRPLMRYWKRLHARWLPASLHVGTLVAIVVAIPFTWSTWGEGNITDDNYIPLTLYTWLVFTAPPYGVWLALRFRLRPADAPPSAWFGMPTLRRVTDVALFPAVLLANVSGFPILYFGTKDTALKYVAKYWHTWPSIAFAILVFVHVLHRWPETVAHWRRVGRRLPPVGEPKD